MKNFYKLIFSFLFFGVAVENSFGQGCGITVTSGTFNAAPIAGPQPVSCFGDSTGLVELFFCNGIASTNYPYCFEWHSGSSTGPLLSSGTLSGQGQPPLPAGSGLIDSLPAGDYYLVIYNSTTPIPGIRIQPYTVTAPSSIFLASLTSTSPPSCSGTCLNSATADGTGGTPPYYFNWSTPDVDNAVLTSTSDSICTGNYTVTITDDAGCDTIIDFFIDISPLPVADAGLDQLICDGDPGVIIGGSPTATAGTSPFTYLWTPDGGTLSSDVDSNPIASPVSTTTYTVTVTDVNNCEGTDDITITVNPFISLDLFQLDIACFGDSSGIAAAEASGGVSPFTYLWNTNPPQANDSAFNLLIGTYTVTVTDGNNCTKVDSVVITQPTIFSAALTSSLPPSCSGTCLNSATADGAGGTPPYDFTWSSTTTELDVTTSTDNNLCGGISPLGDYSVTITDDAGCDTIIDFHIDASPLPLADAGNDQLLCDGDPGVTIGGSPTATAGTSPFTYLWTPDGGTLSSDVDSNPIASPVSTTTYTVTVTDVNNCEGTDDVTITVNPFISLDLFQLDVACFGDSSGIAAAEASGGVSPFTYLWNTNPPQANDSAFNLLIGTYTVTVTDGSNCTKVDSVTISEPPILSLSISAIPISCNSANDGSATANPSGGTTNYSFLWSGGQITQTINSLSPGTYCVTVTDANGCDTSACITLADPPAIVPDFSKTDITCNGLCNGTASVSPSGGTSPYSVIWNPGAFSSALSVSALCPGNYSVIIIDNSGCISTTPFTITEPPAIVPNPSATDVSCSGNCDGIITCAPTGGTSPYSFNWDIPSSDQTVDSLCTGTYNLTVTDANGCSATGSATINSPSAISINLVAIDATCPSYCNGTVSVSPSGGVSPYTIIWDDGSTSSPYDSLCSGAYGVTVTDATGCSVSQSFSITAPATLDPNPSQSDPTCNGAATGSACVAPTGGTFPYTYSWSCSGSTLTCANSISAGACTVTITDFNGCIKTQSFTLLEPPAISTTASTVNGSCSGFCDGVGSISASGGISPYTYEWSDGQTDTLATGLCADTHLVTVTDVNLCEAVDTVIITTSVIITITSTIVNEDCNAIGCDGTATATADGGAGPYDFTWSNGDFANGDTISLADSLCAQTYFISATDVNGCLSTDSIVMTVADSVLQITDSVINVSCNGDSDGVAIALVTGGTGTGTYSYSWLGFPDTDSVLTDLLPGTYSVLVIDGNQCRDSLDIDIAEPAVLDASASGVDISCNGSCTGIANASQSGGTSPYSYLWNDGQTTQTATGLCVDTFYVTVTDLNGCSDSASVIISQPVALSVAMSSDSVSCNGGNDGSATAAPAGGTSPYSYSWSVPQITSTVTGLTAGTYFVTVTDANGCSVMGSVTVSEPAALSVNVSKTDVLCNGNCNGAATATPSGGTSPYTFSWSNSQTTQTVTGLCAVTASVTVTDANGCQTIGSVTISEPSALSISTSKTNVTCNGLCDGTGTGTASGGTSPYTYLWSNGQSIQSATGLCIGTFTVTATDSNGCTITGTVTITQPSAINATPNPISSNCGVCDGVAKFTLSGGTPGYTHSWNTGSTTYPLTGVCAAIYTDTIRDANTCILIAIIAVSNIDGPDGATIITDNSSCFAACNGSAAIIAVSGGTSPYTYLWPDIETDTIMAGICESSNILQITDATGCIHFQSFAIDEPDSLEAGLLVTDATCSGLSDGNAMANPSGGISPYSYSWITGAGTQNLSSQFSGIYPVTVTDNNGCTVLDTADIGEATALNLSLTPTDVLCNGAATGSVLATPSGGTTPYSYSWNDGQTTSNATGLMAGIYSVSISDINGCSITGSDTVNESSALSISSSVIDATCGLNDGSITVTASGGNSPYIYSWLNLQTGSTATGLAAGTESVIVTDVNSCSDTFNIGVSNINGPGTSASVTNASCNAICDGSASVSVTSGVSPFTYLWTPGSQTTGSVTGLCPGDYNIEVTDSNNCTTVQNITVSEPSAISASFTKTNVACKDVCDGTATVTATGGIVPYTFLWSTGDTTQFISSLCDGTYSVTITDANACAGTGSVTITEPSLLTATATGSAVSCNGDCNGTATVSPSGGTPGYTYSWSSGASSSIVASLCAGSYSVTVTDANGCTATDSVTVTQPNAIAITAIIIETTCGNCSGTIAISASGGTSPYTRLWSTGSAAASVSNLCPNIYSITVTDANGCSSDSSFIINNSDGPIPVLTGDTASCFNSCDATASSVTAGGTSPYTFLWDDPSSQTGSSATGLCDGTYELYVTDATGCIGIGTTTISESLLLTNTITASDADCNSSCNVTATSSVSGGTSPYVFAWDNGQTGIEATGLCSGTYFVTVTDANACSRIDSIVVDETTTLSLAISGTNSNCFNSCDGIATANVSGGATPYSYLWSNGSITPVITNLCDGTYILTITDNNGCVKIDSSIITEPSLLNATINGTDVNCNGGTDGSATVSASGGTTPYNYNWSPSGQTDSTSTGLSIGTHSVTVTDANGCTIDTSIVINQPSVLTLDSIVTANTACGDSSGTAAVFVSGGATPYTYNWSNGDITQTADSLVQGSYSVTITYNGTCDTSFSGIVIANTNGPAVAMSSSDALCNGDCNGTATANVSGGTTPYSYVWSDGQSDSTATGLCAGTHDITVTDGLGCITLASVSVGEPSLLVLDTTSTDITCFGANNGSATVSVSGGISPYSFLWSTGATSASLSGLSAGTYCVTVTDSNGCDPSVCVTINEPAALFLTTSFTNTTCNGTCDGSASVSVNGGISPYSFSWSNGQTDSTATGLCDGAYTVTITDANNCTNDTSFIISEPSAIAATFTQSQPACADSNGSMTINVTGGTPFSSVSPYTYNWSNLQTDSTATGLAAGTYSVTVTDSLGCTATFSTTISNLNGPTVVIDSVDSVSCFGLNDGNVFVTATGVNVPFTFNWNNGQTTEDALNLVAGNDTLTVTDTAGCVTIIDTVISEPALLSANISATDATCGNCNAIATAVVSGGTGSYSFIWGNPQTTITTTGLCAGADSVVVTDENGCTAAANTTIIDIAGPAGISFLSTDVSCFGLCNGSSTASVVGGTSPFTYLWSDNQTDSTATGLCAGTDTITITDANGCTVDSTVTINQPSDIVADSIVIKDANCGASNGKIEMFISGCTTPYTYLWNDATTNSSNNGLSAGVYSVTVTCNLTCSKVFSNLIVSNTNGPAVTTTSANITCNAACNGTITANVSGTNSPFTYLWSNGDSTIVADSLCPGNYSVSVTNSIGCITIANDSVSEPAMLVISAISTNISCNGANDGMAIASASGGTSPYSFLWSNAVSNDTVSNLSAGNYCVTITDANGCFDDTCIIITEPTALSLSVSSNNVTCFGACNGNANVSASGGSSPYSYSWSNLQSDSTATGLCAGSYSVTITDATGCAIDSSVSVTEPNDIVADSIVVVDASCLASNGSATIFISGGNSPLSYLWTNGDSAALSDSLFAGNYSVTVTDSSSCSKTFTNIIINNTNGPSVSTAVTDVLCNGDCNGTMTATASGGTPPYVFVWSTGDTIPFVATSTIDSLCIGTFTVTVVDFAGCGTIAADTVNEPQILVAAVTPTNIVCNGENNGNASASGSGGVSPYTFLWSNGETTSSIDSLSPGNYCVTVSDANGCTDSACVLISDPPSLSITLTSNNVSCNSLCNGDASASVSGGTSPYSIVWSNGDNSINADSLCAGIYLVTATDANGCFLNDSVTISEPAAIVSDSMNTVSPPCGDSTGTATVFASGGVEPFTYQWIATAGNQTTQTATGLKAGAYPVTVTDSTGCENIFTANVSNLGAQTVSLIITDVSCGGNCDGMALASVSGGSTPYSYLWNNSATTDTINSLCPGPVSVTVTDFASCIVIASDTVNAGNILVGSMSAANVLCNGDSTGSITVSVTGGSTPYTYLWDNGQTGSIATGLIAGIYCVTVNDAGGCIFTGCDTVSQPDSALLVNTTTTITSCFGSCDGTANAAVSGGTSPYSYLWCNGSTVPSILGCAINCAVTITDANGCISSTSAIIPEPPAITLIDTLTLPTCGSNNGAISISVSGGTPSSSGYNILWDNTETTATITGLAAGTYCVTITDSLGCTFDSCYTLVTPGNALITLDSIDNATCNGSCDGKIFISVTGNSPFTFSWSNGDTVDDPDSLCTGTYFLTITDSLGCTTTFDTSVTEPPAITTTFTIVNAACGACDGNATVSVSGGTSPYTYLWVNGQTDTTATGLCAGADSLFVTDTNGCSSVFIATISNLGGPDSVTFSTVNLSCFGSCDGSVSATVFGGSSPFSFNWSTPGNTDSIGGLCAGNYILSVTDSSGCLFVADTDIIQPPIIDVVFTVSVPSCGANDGSITAITSGGAPFASGYSYEWTGGQTNPTATGFGPGTYFVTVTDSIGCDNIFDTTLSNSDAMVFVTAINATCFGLCNGSITTDSISGTNLPFSYVWPGGQTDSTISSLCPGDYSLTITDALGCQKFQDYTISEPTELTALYTLTNASCGSCNGVAVITVSGGTSPYSYLWSNNQTTNMANGLCAGVYSTFVTDSNLCLVTFSTGINNDDSLIATTSSTDASCFGQCDGSAVVTASGGVTPYTYFWVGSSPVDTTSSANNLCAGNHFVEITGGNGCIHTAMVTINQPPALIENSLVNPPTCSGNNGSVEATISGGTSPYVYSWNNSDNDSLNSNLAAGIYILTVTDNNGSGCSQVFTYTLNSDSAPSLAISGTDATCNSLCNGQSTVTPSGGISPYTYQWLNSSLTPVAGQIDSTATSLCAGIYFAQVTDAASCLSSIQVEIEEPSPLDTSLIISTANLCFGNCIGTANAVISGGIPPYNYLWNDPDGQTINPATALCSGNYSVIITDANNCSISQGVFINQPAPVTVDTNSVTDALCFDSNNGAIDLNVSGGTSGYSYNWTGPNIFTASTEDINSLLPGTYFVTVTDANSCDTTASVVVDTTISLLISKIQDTMICEGTGGILYVGNASGNGNISYNWIDASTNNTIGTSDTLLITPSVGINEYYVIATVSGFCAVEDTFMITINSSPVVDAGNGATIVKGVTATVGGSPTASGGNPPYTYAWLPIEGLDDPTLSNPVALPGQTTTYSVTVTTADGCSASDSTEVTVVPLIEYISGFSPNGDGINETWQIDYVEQFPDIVVEIYNRWGQLLFRSVGYKDGWDGTYNGKPLPIGTYYYVIVLNHPKFPDPITGPVTIVK